MKLHYFLFAAMLPVVFPVVAAAARTTQDSTPEVRCVVFDEKDSSVCFVLDTALWQLRQAATVSVAGTFNFWDADAEGYRMSFDGGQWKLRLPVDSVDVPGNCGRPEYKFVADGKFAGSAAHVEDGLKNSSAAVGSVETDFCFGLRRQHVESYSVGGKQSGKVLSVICASYRFGGKDENFVRSVIEGEAAERFYRFACSGGGFGQYIPSRHEFFGKLSIGKIFFSVQKQPYGVASDVDISVIRHSKSSRFFLILVFIVWRVLSTFLTGIDTSSAISL